MEKRVSGRVDKLHAAALFTTILLVFPASAIVLGIASTEGKMNAEGAQLILHHFFQFTVTFALAAIIYGISKIVELIEAK